MLDLKRIKERGKLIRPILTPLILYIGLLAVSKNTVPTIENNDFGVIISLLPMIPGVWISYAIINMVGEFDELEQIISREAIEISFFITLLFSNTIGVMQLSREANFNSISLSFFMIIIFIVGKIVAKKKYS